MGLHAYLQLRLAQLSSVSLSVKYFAHGSHVSSIFIVLLVPFVESVTLVRTRVFSRAKNSQITAQFNFRALCKVFHFRVTQSHNTSLPFSLSVTDYITPGRLPSLANHREVGEPQNDKKRFNSRCQSRHRPTNVPILAFQKIQRNSNV